MDEKPFEWNDELVIEFCHMLGQGPYGVFKGAHKLEEKIKRFKVYKTGIIEKFNKFY